MIQLYKDSMELLDNKRLTKDERLVLEKEYNVILKTIREGVKLKFTVNHKMKKYLKENLSKEQYAFFCNDVAHYLNYPKDVLLFFKRK